ncbi:MAG: RNA-protein complex protein Nop10 [Thermoprotei archaeon]|nr:MAG: RNA-protein complex protein Nop10 [Thermoprotei archaeon]
MGRQGLLRRCEVCGAYTLSQDKCPKCGGPVRTPHPPKFSPDDRFAKYRLAMKLTSGILKVSDEVREKILKSLLKT